MHPTLLHLGPLALPTFGALAALGLMLALALSERTARLTHIPPQALWDAGLFATVAAFVLSRALLFLQYSKNFRAFPILLLTVPSLTAPALILALIATAAWLLWKHVPLRQALDAWAPCATLLWAFLALGHFAEGSDPGMPSTLPWALPVFAGDLTAQVRVHPVPLYAAAIAALITVLAYIALRHATPSVGAFTLVAVGLAQFLLSFLRQPGDPGFLGIETLQWTAIAMLLAGLILVLTSPAEPANEARPATMA